MNAINVLSDTLKAGGGLTKSLSIKGENVTNNLENGIADFAGILSGLKSINADPIGQNSKLGQDLEEVQNSDRYGQNPGYGHFALSFLSEPLVLSGIPTGKEASFGNGVNQGTGEGLSADDKQSIVALSMLSLESNEVFLTKGILSQIPQGNNPEITELDKYRQIIAELLGALSGQITDSSSKAVSTTDVLPQQIPLVLERGTSERQGMMNVTPLDLNEGVSTKGMTSQMPQGNNTDVMDFNKYRQIIAELLEALSGKITDLSPKGVSNTHLSPEEASFSLGRGISERQESAKLAQRWLSVTEDMLNNAQATRAQNPVVQSLNGQAVENLERYTPLHGVNYDTAEDKANSKIMNYDNLTKGIEGLRQVIARTVQDWMKETDGVSEGHYNAIQTVIKPVIDFLTTQQETGSRELSTKASWLLVVLNQILTQAQQANVHQGVIKEMPQGVATGKEIPLQPDFIQNLARVVQGAVSEESTKGYISQYSDSSESKASQNPNQGLGLGSVGNIVTGNVADGKTVSIPVWEQISNAFRQQVTSQQHRELKDLDIRLHPAELGRIQIGMRWENGQVHLQVYASEPATGQLLQNQLSELRQMLTNQGVNCGTLQMGQQGRDQQQKSQGDQAQRTLDPNSILGEDEEAISGLNPVIYGQDGRNRINVTA